MSRPHLLPPLAPETLAALDRLAGKYPDLAPRHEVNADTDPRLLEIVQQVARSEKHLRTMHTASQAGELESFGTMDGKPLRATAQWARRCLDAFTEIVKVATDAKDEAFPRHIEIIQKGLDNPPMPIRWRVWMAYKQAAIGNRPSMSENEFCELMEKGVVNRQKYIPSAGEVAAMLGDSKCAEITVRDCTKHLKALGLPYAAARRGG